MKISDLIGLPKGEEMKSFKCDHDFETLRGLHVVEGTKPGYVLALVPKVDHCKKCQKLENRRQEEEWLPISEQYTTTDQVIFKFKP